MESIFDIQILLSHRADISWIAWGILRLGLIVVTVVNIRLIGRYVYIELIYSIVGDRICANKQIHASPGVLHI